MILYFSPVQRHWRLSFPPQLIHGQQISNVIFEKLKNITKKIKCKREKKSILFLHLLWHWKISIRFQFLLFSLIIFSAEYIKLCISYFQLHTKKKNKQQIWKTYYSLFSNIYCRNQTVLINSGMGGVKLRNSSPNSGSTCLLKPSLQQFVYSPQDTFTYMPTYFPRKIITTYKHDILY